MGGAGDGRLRGRRSRTRISRHRINGWGMSSSEFFPDFIARHAEEFPDRVAVVLAKANGGEIVEEPLTFAELDRAARAVAVWLGEQGIEAGRRALLLHPTGLDFVKAFFGCMYAGVTPVPAPLPGGQRHHLTRATGIALDADVSVVLTDNANLPAIADWLSQDGLDRIVCAATSMAEQADPGAWTRPEGVGDGTLAFLQYTSGSTSDPKGVMVTQANLFHNLRLIESSIGLQGYNTFCSWLPLYHDMGLIGLFLLPLYLGSTAILMSPVDFLKRPHLWLRLIDRHDVLVTSAPNFAYDLCARKVTDEQLAGLDLSRWEVACNGAEPIDATALDRFAERFAGAGFRREAFLPCYGMAETTLYVSGTRREDAPLVTRMEARALEKNVLRPVGEDEDGPLVVSCGIVNELDVRIVDPESRTVLPEGEVGEIWVRGGSVAVGYWGKERETRETFQAETTGGERGFLRTGDLGAFLGDQLYVTGRIKEMVITHGRNLYPQDVEREVRAVHPAVASGATSVFSVVAAQEEIVVVQEIRPRDLGGTTPEELVRKIRYEVGNRLGVHIGNVVLVRPGKVRKTTSGKIQRRLMRELFQANALEILHEELAPGTRQRFRPTPAQDGGSGGETA
ncbi:fatty acyl-AMP ligase [Streptomyces luteoverticillatus]|uniref:Fatty acyl-AMP ligase n=2 Tax=Streptomyces TaxID=1883 RepID=A0A3Q9FVD7_STRLT|nr:fatty acyl-AMP ligase [Streptomyces luteoverticillatus]